MIQSVTNQATTIPMGSFLNNLKPWVSVICTAYNHASYITEALQSVVNQTHPNVELIVIDNASTDQTADQIRDFCTAYPAIRFIQNSANVGLCRAFNQGLAIAGGTYVIDLSADDVLLPNRIAKQTDLFERLPARYGVLFSNAAHVDANGVFINTHFPVNEQGKTTVEVPTGNVFAEILRRYFVCTPTMMIRRAVLDDLGGYDETLAYEDFDFWVRSARRYHYAYQDEILTHKRQLPNSLSAQVVKPENYLLESTLRVCQKALALCQTDAERQALAERLRQFTRKAFYAEQFDLALCFGALLRQIENPDTLTTSVLWLSRRRLRVNKLYRKLLRFRQNPKPGAVVGEIIR
jgi:glycosyltransferase involved in cell wall biosynthesis